MFILASQSPRRVDLLSLLGWDFVVKPSEVDESLMPGEDAQSYVIRLAHAKAQAVLRHAPPEAVVIGSDTAVVDGDEILGKPTTTDEAERMLRQLRGRTHQVYSAVAVVRASDGESRTDLCITEVPMRAFSDEELRSYVDSGDPMDKAGAYAIQNAGFQPVSVLAGCFANVMGLPLCHLTRTLRQLGLSPRKDVPTECQMALNYDCPVYEKVLSLERTI